MKEIFASVTTKGQVTIPSEVRQILKVKPREKVSFTIDGDQVRIQRRGSVVARTKGILKGTEPPLSARELREAAEIAIAEEVEERTNK